MSEPGEPAATSTMSAFPWTRSVASSAAPHSMWVETDCPCPGGGKDPKKDEHWQEYRERRKQAEEAGKVGQSSKGKGKGKGKSKGKDSKTKPEAAKGGNQPQQAKACVDLARAAAVDSDVSAKFPRDGVALDSWANVWLKHVKDQPSSYFQDKLQLAYGDCLCHKETSKKGVPIVFVPWPGPRTTSTSSRKVSSGREDARSHAVIHSLSEARRGEPSRSTCG